MGDLIYRLLLFLNSSDEDDINYNIAMTMLKNIKLIPDMSINKLATLCYTSPAAITRFCHRLGYPNFIDFKYNMKININHYTKGLMKPKAINYDISREEVLHNMKLEVIDEIEKFETFLDLKVVDRVIELLFNTPCVYIFGTQYSQLMAQDLQLKLAGLSKIIHHANDVQNQEKMAEKLGENSLAILISPTGRFLAYHEKLWGKIANSKSKVVVITEEPKKEYVDRSDYIIYLPTSNNQNEYTQTHRYDLSYLIQYIYIRYGNLYS